MSIASEHLDLIQADLDGELDGPARAELARYLLAHPEARAEREALARVCSALDSIPAEAPPPDLQSRVMAALPPLRRGSPAPLRFAAGLAGAALVATLAYQLGATRAPLPSSHLVGTMAQPAQDHVTAAAAGAVRDEARVQVGPFAAVIALHGTPTSPRVSVSVQAGAGLEVVARAGDQEIRLDAPALSHSSGGAPVVEFQPLPQPGTGAVQVDIVDPVSDAVLQRTTLRFGAEQ
jgi:anti-sigma factor RsiW